MLKLTHSASARRDRGSPLPAKQSGAVLMISLMILVALTIAGLALIRSVDTTNVIAGNLAFQQAAVHSGEAGTEDAISAFLNTHSTTTMQSDDFANAYAASTPASGNPANWDTYWATVINPNPVGKPVMNKTCVDRVCTLPTDASGNTASYTIQRLCPAAGDPKQEPRCPSFAPKPEVSVQAGVIPLPPPLQYYYRITTRVDGPRNTLSYIQTIVAR